MAPEEKMTPITHRILHDIPLGGKYQSFNGEMYYIHPDHPPITSP